MLPQYPIISQSTQALTPQVGGSSQAVLSQSSYTDSHTTYFGFILDIKELDAEGNIIQVQYNDEYVV